MCGVWGVGFRAYDPAFELGRRDFDDVGKLSHSLCVCVLQGVLPGLAHHEIAGAFRSGDVLLFILWLVVLSEFVSPSGSIRVRGVTHSLFFRASALVSPLSPLSWALEAQSESAATVPVLMHGGVRAPLLGRGCSSIPFLGRANRSLAVHGEGPCGAMRALTRCSLVQRPVTAATTTLDAFQVLSIF